MITDMWTGCYRRGWGKELIPAAYQHPAKVSFSLAERIYQHVIAEGWAREGSICIDPFAGIGGFAYHALKAGMHFRGVELEQKFVNLAAQNIALWNARYAGRFARWGSAHILQGDSRQLLEVLAENGINLVVSSPPYANVELNDSQRQAQDSDFRLEQPQTYNLAVSSPPFLQTSGGTNVTSIKGPLSNPALIERHAAGNAAAQGYGKSKTNIANLPEGQPPTLIVGSPPYAGSLETAGGIDATKSEHVGGPHSQMNNSDTRYGHADGQLAMLPEGDAPTMAVSSPPYEGSNVIGGPQINRENIALKKDLTIGINGSKNYIGSEGQIGATSGDTFWSAAREIVSQTYAALVPGGHACFVTKRYVRNGQIVEFSQQWAMLCESVGFKLVHWHRAMLTEDNGIQLATDGNHKRQLKKRSSFFRRLHEKKHPETAIDWEDVLCLEK